MSVIRSAGGGFDLQFVGQREFKARILADQVAVTCSFGEDADARGLKLVCQWSGRGAAALSPTLEMVAPNPGLERPLPGECILGPWFLLVATRRVWTYPLSYQRQRTTPNTVTSSPGRNQYVASGRRRMLTECLARGAASFPCSVSELGRRAGSLYRARLARAQPRPYSCVGTFHSHCLCWFMCRTCRSVLFCCWLRWVLVVVVVLSFSLLCRSLRPHHARQRPLTVVGGKRT